MEHAQLISCIDRSWERRTELEPGDARTLEAVKAALALLNSGQTRVAEPDGKGGWQVNEWLKKAVLLWFRLHPNVMLAGGPGGGAWWDKIPSKFADWGPEEFEKSGFRAVPPCAVRYGAHIAPTAVLMPCYVNIGAYVDEGAMIDTWATVGSCAQIGKRVHVSGGAGIGGVLEPLQASPVIIEDDCFIGARSEVAEGVIVREGAVLAMGVFLSQSTKIIDRASGEVFYGEVPPCSVVVPGALPDPKGGPSLACAVIVKRVDARTRAKTAVNDLLRP